MLIVGEKEADAGQVALRVQGDGDKGSMSVEAFAAYIEERL